MANFERARVVRTSEDISQVYPYGSPWVRFPMYDPENEVIFCPDLLISRYVLHVAALATDGTVGIQLGDAKSALAQWGDIAPRFIHRAVDTSSRYVPDSQDIFMPYTSLMKEVVTPSHEELKELLPLSFTTDNNKQTFPFHNGAGLSGEAIQSLACNLAEIFIGKFNDSQIFNHEQAHYIQSKQNPMGLYRWQNRLKYMIPTIDLVQESKKLTNISDTLGECLAIQAEVSGQDDPYPVLSGRLLALVSSHREKAENDTSLDRGIEKTLSTHEPNNNLTTHFLATIILITGGEIIDDSGCINLLLIPGLLKNPTSAQIRDHLIALIYDSVASPKLLSQRVIDPTLKARLEAIYYQTNQKIMDLKPALSKK